MIASLTVARMVPVALSLLGLRLMPETMVFGLTMLTVLASVFVHGATAWPGVRW